MAAPEEIVTVAVPVAEHPALVTVTVKVVVVVNGLVNVDWLFGLTTSPAGAHV